MGQLQDRSKPLIFAMARLDKVKNLTGLAGVGGRGGGVGLLVNMDRREDKVENLTGLACVGRGMTMGLRDRRGGGWRVWAQHR